MKKTVQPLKFHLITSYDFWVGAPMIISEILNRRHYFSAFDEDNLPSFSILLNCDVLIDMSTITNKSFYRTLSRHLNHRRSLGATIPFMIDPPAAIINSFDKRITHKLFPDLIPESYTLTGKENEAKISKFRNDQFVVIKPPEGWCGNDIERLSPRQALIKYKDSRNFIVQKYIPHINGVGRIVTFFHNNDFEIAASYRRIPKAWRTGSDVKYSCENQMVTKDLEEFALNVSERCGLYFNGIDYIFHDGKIYLLEVNAVPAMQEPWVEFGINIPKKLLNHIERNLPPKNL